MTGEPIKLARQDDGTLKEQDADVYWTGTEFTNGACPDGSACGEEMCEMGHDQCTVCEQDLPTFHYVCLDDGSCSAHSGCVVIEG